MKSSGLPDEEDIQFVSSAVSVFIEILLKFGSSSLEDVRQIHGLMKRSEVREIATIERWSIVPLFRIRGTTGRLKSVAGGDGVSDEVGVGGFATQVENGVSLSHV